MNDPQPSLDDSAAPVAAAVLQAGLELEEGDRKALADFATPLSKDRLNKKYRRDYMERLGTLLELDVIGKNRDEIRGMLITRLRPKSEIPPVQAFMPPQAVEAMEDTGTGTQWRIRCVGCGSPTVLFKRGFDPRQPPTGADGKKVPFHMWPFRFIGHPHQDQYAIQNRSREFPTCAKCEHAIPLRNDRTTVLSRVLEIVE